MTQRGDEASTSDRDIVVRRVFDAPRDLVWKAWTDPRQLAVWWGPDGFTTTIHEMDLRVGGTWNHTMHGPDGTDYLNACEFLEVDPPNRIAYRLSAHKQSEPPHEAYVMWTFEAVGNRTRLTLLMRFPSAALRDAASRTYGVREGGEATLDRLLSHLSAP